jgi:hypothetical protein
MPDTQKERWMGLCALAAKEQDSEKLLALVAEINEILEEKEAFLHQTRLGPKRERREADHLSNQVHLSFVARQGC